MAGTNEANSHEARGSCLKNSSPNSLAESLDTPTSLLLWLNGRFPWMHKEVIPATCGRLVQDF